MNDSKFPPPDIDFSLVTGEGRMSSVDNKTIYNTPDPIAASTVVRQNKHHARTAAHQTSQGSFIEDNSSTMTSPPDQDSLGALSFGDASTFRRGEASASSSFGHVGLIDVGNMPDLSASVLEFDENPTEVPPTPVIKPHVNITSEGGSHQNSSKEQSKKEADSKSTKVDVAPGGLAFGGAVRFGNEEHDVSVHEVKLDYEELQKFDEDFSDVGDFDNTLTDESNEKGQSHSSMQDLLEVADIGPPHSGCHNPPSLDLLDEPPPERNPLRLGDEYAEAYFQAQQEYMPGAGEMDEGEGGDLFSNPNDPMGLPLNLHMEDQDEGYDEIDFPQKASEKSGRPSEEFWEKQRLAGRPLHYNAERNEGIDPNGGGQETMPSDLSIHN